MATSEQPDLFDSTRYYARNADPATSHAAAAKLDHARVHRARILATLDSIGSGTFEEIAAASGMRNDQVWRRLSDLRRMGEAEPNGEERPGASGRKQRVWRRARK